MGIEKTGLEASRRTVKFLRGRRILGAASYVIGRGGARRPAVARERSLRRVLVLFRRKTPREGQSGGKVLVGFSYRKD